MNYALYNTLHQQISILQKQITALFKSVTLNHVKIVGSLFDNTGNAGTNGQVLSSNNNKVVWKDVGNVSLSGGTNRNPQIFTGTNRFIYRLNSSISSPVEFQYLNASNIIMSTLYLDGSEFRVLSSDMDYEFKYNDTTFFTLSNNYIKLGTKLEGLTNTLYISTYPNSNLYLGDQTSTGTINIGNTLSTTNLKGNTYAITQSSNNNSNKIATTKYVDNAIQAVQSIISLFSFYYHSFLPSNQTLSSIPCIQFTNLTNKTNFDTILLSVKISIKNNNFNVHYSAMMDIFPKLFVNCPDNYLYLNNAIDNFNSNTNYSSYPRDYFTNGRPIWCYNILNENNITSLFNVTVANNGTTSTIYFNMKPLDFDTYVTYNFDIVSLNSFNKNDISTDNFNSDL